MNTRRSTFFGGHISDKPPTMRSIGEHTSPAADHFAWRKARKPASPDGALSGVTRPGRSLSLSCKEVCRIPETRQAVPEKDRERLKKKYEKAAERAAPTALRIQVQNEGALLTRHSI
jgi:hypothetical protein